MKCCWLLEVRRRFPVAFFVLFNWNVEFLQTFAFIFVCHKKTSFFGQMPLVRKRWVHETASTTRINGSCNHCIEQKNSATIIKKKKRFQSFKVFSCLKKVNPSILSTFERSFSKKTGKTPGSHIIHSLRGEYCWIAMDNCKIVGLVFLHLSKAFDLVSNDILLSKIAKYHASQPTLRWFRSYLCDWTPTCLALSLEYYLTHSRWHKASHKDRF